MAQLYTPHRLCRESCNREWDSHMKMMVIRNENLCNCDQIKKNNQKFHNYSHLSSCINHVFSAVYMDLLLCPCRSVYIWGTIRNCHFVRWYMLFLVMYFPTQAVGQSDTTPRVCANTDTVAPSSYGSSQLKGCRITSSPNNNKGDV